MDRSFSVLSAPSKSARLSRAKTPENEHESRFHGIIAEFGTNPDALNLMLIAYRVSSAIAKSRLFRPTSALFTKVYGRKYTVSGVLPGAEGPSGVRFAARAVGLG